jgi:hypothetical protein
MACVQHEMLLSHGIVIDNFSKKMQQVGEFLFASHNHSDHVKGLSVTNFKNIKPIICSETTKHLLQLQFPHLRNFIILQPNKVLRLNSVISVRAFPANHMDGSIMLWFHIHNLTILITSDYKFYPQLKDNSWLKHVDECMYDDTFQKVSHTLPTYTETYTKLCSTISRIGLSETVYFNVSVLGIEPLLRLFAVRNKAQFAISPGLKNSYRAKQLKYLFPTQINTKSRFVLAHKKMDTVEPLEYWLFFSCSFAFCPLSAESNNRHTKINFCTHSSKHENQLFKKLLKPRVKFTPCQSANQEPSSFNCNRNKKML